MPDLRLRVTRRYDVLDYVPKKPGDLAADITLAWGTPDAVYTNCRLIKQDIPDGQNKNPAKSPNDPPPILIRVYEQLPATAELSVGEPDVTIGQDGLYTIVDDLLQFSLAVAGVTNTYGVPGTTVGPAPWATTTVLKTEERDDDGTIQHIKRTYVSKGLISQTDETHNEGALLLRTLTYVNQTPPTPSGYTLITAKVDYPGGLPVFTYTFAKGAGRVSIDTVTKYQGALVLTTIRYFNTDSGGTPSGVLIDSKDDQGDGYVISERTYAVGSGTIETTVDTQNNGALLLQTIRALGGAPSTPGGYIVISTDLQSSDGYAIYTYKFAKGNGVISTQTEYRLSPDLGVTGMTITTIKYLSDPSITSNPITPPASTVNTSTTVDDSDGHRIWTAIYAAGTGTVATDTEIRNKGKLIIYTVTAINAAPSAPSPTIGGTVVLIGRSQRNGTRFEDGTVIYDYKWAEGVGIIAQEIHIRTDGLREQTYTSLGTRTAPSFGIVIRDEQEDMQGVTKYTVTAMQNAAGGDPTTASLSLPRRVHFTYPGRAKAYTLTSSNGYKIADVFLSPPVETEVDATVAITYQSSNVISGLGTIWQPTDGAVIYAEWIGLSSIPGYKVAGLRGYRSFSATPVTVTASSWGGGTGGVMMGNIVFGGTTASVTVSGGPADPGGSTFVLDYSLEPAFTDVSGTVYYRKTVISAAIPAQTALPV